MILRLERPRRISRHRRAKRSLRQETPQYTVVSITTKCFENVSGEQEKLFFWELYQCCKFFLGMGDSKTLSWEQHQNSLGNMGGGGGRGKEGTLQFWERK